MTEEPTPPELAAGAAARSPFESARAWGARECELRTSPDDPPNRCVSAGLAVLDELGLASARTVQGALGSAEGASHVVVRLAPARTLQAGHGERGADGPRLAPAHFQLAAGFLTGWVSTVARCEAHCEPHPAADGDEREGRAIAIRTAGAAGLRSGAPRASHFFLDSLEGSLGDQELSLADMVENTHDAIILLDSRNAVRFWNRGAERMFQYDRGEVLGRTADFLLPPDLQDEGELNWLRSVCESDGSILVHTTRRLRKDGELVWVSMSRTVLHDRAGRVIGAAATLRDISAEQAREEELRRTQFLAQIGELAADLAHEVKNPLAGIHAAIQVLKSDLAPTEPAFEVFSSIDEEVLRLNHITTDLLSFARPPEPELEDAELRPLLLGLTEHLQRDPALNGHEIEFDVPPNVTAPIDAKLTIQVFTNLILNAAQAMHEPGTILVRSRVLDGRVAVDVCDSGPGVPEHLSAALFDPFFTSKVGGTGLGLSIAKKNMEIQGGSIRLVTPARPGAVFRVEFAESQPADRSRTPR